MFQRAAYTDCEIGIANPEEITLATRTQEDLPHLYWFPFGICTGGHGIITVSVYVWGCQVSKSFLKAVDWVAREYGKDHLALVYDWAEVTSPVIIEETATRSMSGAATIAPLPGDK